MKPLTPSPASVNNAAALLPVRSTFVAPGFPDPYSCGSGKPNALLTTTANDTDPMRYAATTNRKEASTSSFGGSSRIGWILEQCGMNAIFIHDLRVETKIGVYEWERHLPQTIRIDLEFGLPSARPFTS